MLIAAGVYLLIGRLIRAVLPPKHHSIFHIPARRLTLIFVLADVLSLMIQSAGSGIASSTEWVGSTADVGINVSCPPIVPPLPIILVFSVAHPRGNQVLLGGLGFQCFSLCAFGAVLLRFFYLAHPRGKCMATRDAPKDWAAFVKALMLIVACIFVRSHPIPPPS